MASKAKTVDIVGGGLSGLVTGYFLIKMGFQVRIFEKNRWGGLLGTTQTPYGPVESAANAFMSNRVVEEISKEIGVPLCSKKKVARKRYIFRNGKPRRWPLGPVETLRLLWGLLWLKVVGGKTLLPNGGDSFLSLEAWGERVLGAAAVRFLLAPAMQGVYGSQPGFLSARLLMGPLLNKALPRPSRGELRGSVAPEKGMGAWVDGLRQFLQNEGCTFLQQAAVPVAEVADSTVQVIAVDFDSAKAWLPELRSVPGVDLTSVTVFFDKASATPPEGFGCLFPKDEGFSSLGVLYNHWIFDQRVSGEGFSETWIFDKCADGPDLLANILEDRARLVGSSNFRVLEHAVHPWPRAIPLYGEALEKFLRTQRPQNHQQFFVGNYWGRLGLGKLVIQAQESAQKIKEQGVWQNTVS